MKLLKKAIKDVDYLSAWDRPAPPGNRRWGLGTAHRETETARERET